jgi:tetrahydromethanopterin S-methyltransferase subunit G
MAKRVLRKTAQRDIFVKELLAFERRLDARMERRFEIQTESLKAYVDSRFFQVNTRFDVIDKKFDANDKRFDAIDKRFDAIDKRIDALDRKLDVRTDGLVNLIERGFGEIATYGTIFQNHEKRISILEQKT